MPQNESPSREDRVNEAIAAFLQAVERGEKPDLARFVAGHADLAAEWNSFLASRSQSRMATGRSPATRHRRAVPQIAHQSNPHLSQLGQRR